MAVTSEASDGQSAMEMVILYCVSLQRRGERWRGGFSSSEVTGTSVLTQKSSPARFAAVLKGRSDRTGTWDPGTVPAASTARVLTCTFPCRSQYRSVCPLCLISVMNSNMLFGENKKSKHLFR